MDETERLVRYQVFQLLLRNCRPPTVDELEKESKIPSSDVKKALHRLEELHHLKLYDSATPSPTPIAMVHPFSHLPTPYVVASRPNQSQTTKCWYANCAWCSFGLAAMLSPSDTDINILTHLGEHVIVSFRNGVLDEVRKEGDPVKIEDCFVIFSPPPSKWWNDVRFACGTIQLCTSKREAEEWHLLRGFKKGEKMGLETLWELSKVWYGGKAKYEYDRMSSEEAEALFGRLGLPSDYWTS